MTTLCSRFTQKFNVSLSSVTDMKPSVFLEKNKALFVVTSRGQVSLKGASDVQQKHRIPAAPRQEQQERQEAKPPGLARKTADDEVPQSTESSDSEQYLELHNKISGRSFNSKIAQILCDVVDVVTEKSFLNIAQVVKGGSVGKGTVISGTTDAEVVFFLRGMPQGQQSKWLPPLLKAVAAVLTQHLNNEHGVEGICTTDDSVTMKVKGCVDVELRFSPDFETYSEVIEAMGQQRPDVRKHFNTALVKGCVDVELRFSPDFE